MIQPLHRNNLMTPTRCDPMLVQPSGDWSIFKQIFADHWEAFQHAHPRYQPSYYEGLVAKMLDCGNPAKMGRVPGVCGECSGTSLDPSAPCLSAGYQHSKPVFNPSYKPPDLHLNTLQLLNLKIINRHRLSDRLWLGPRWHPIHQHLSQAP